MRTTECAPAQPGPSLQGRGDLDTGGGLWGPGLQQRPLQTPSPGRPALPAPRRRLHKGPCGAPERTRPSLRDLTTALPNVGDLFCLSLHILTSTFLRGTAPREGCPHPPCATFIRRRFTKPPVTGAGSTHSHSSGLVSCAGWPAVRPVVGCPLPRAHRAGPCSSPTPSVAAGIGAQDDPRLDVSVPLPCDPRDPKPALWASDSSRVGGRPLGLSVPESERGPLTPAPSQQQGAVCSQGSACGEHKTRRTGRDVTPMYATSRGPGAHTPQKLLGG